MAEVKQSENKAQIIGTLLEKNLAIETNKVTLRSGDGTEKEVTCRQIVKKVFKNPSMTIESNGNVVGVNFFTVSEKKLDENGNIVDNPYFKGLETAMETYVTKAENPENATRVKFDGSLRPAEYVSGRTNEWVSFPQFSSNRISSVTDDVEDSTDSVITGVIRKIMPEVVGDGADETGRLKVELWSFDYRGNATPITFVVDADIAGDFADFYETGQSVRIFYEVVTKHVGGQKVESNGGFGRRNAHIATGYTVTEYSIFRGDEPFEEENEYYVPLDVMKEAVTERDMYIASKLEEKKNAPSGGGFGGNSPKNSTAKASPFGGKSAPADSPF